MAEAKKAYDEYTLQSADISLDVSVVTSQDVGKKQFSSSYTTAKFDTPGVLVASAFEMDKDDGSKLVSIVLDVSRPAKKGDDIDPANSYKATATLKE